MKSGTVIEEPPMQAAHELPRPQVLEVTIHVEGLNWWASAHDNRVAGKDWNGHVKFIPTGPCLLLFENPAYFGRTYLKLEGKPVSLPVLVNGGMTDFTVLCKQYEMKSAGRVPPIV